MPFLSISSRFTIDGAPSAANPTGTAFYNQTFNALQQIYDGSLSAASAIDTWLAAHSNNIVIHFLSGAAQAYPNIGIVEIDPAYFVSNYYISTNGTAVQDTFVSGLTHELGHAVTGKTDNESFSNLSGDNVLNVNTWFAELGFAPQSSYEAYDIGPSVLIPNLQYTAGSPISNAIYDQGPGVYAPLGINTGAFDLTSLGVTGSTLIVGGGGNNSYVGTASKDWIYGQVGIDSLNGGGGDDYLYGGADDDIFVGGGGSDQIWGGDSGIDQGILDGTDKVDYTSNTGFQPIIINFQGTLTSSVITINDGLGGVDNLHSIEEIVGTTGLDLVKISGEIKSNTHLKIDANGGQSPNPLGSIINASPATTSFIVSIGSNGSGYVQSQGGGRIDLVNFHTQIVGSYFDDDISDDSTGKKRIDGGDGNDTISTAGTSGKVVIYGGNGDDTITGGSGNDVIVGDTSADGYYEYSNVLNGGSGNDYIISTSVNDVVDGGSGDDYIKVVDPYLSLGSISGGTGDDVIEIADDNGLPSHLNVTLGSGDGHDALIVPQGYWDSTLLQTHINISMDGLGEGDFTVIVDASANSGEFYDGFADIAVINNSTGDSIYIPDRYVKIRPGEDFNAYEYSDVVINGLDPRGYTYSFGSVDQYKTELTNFDDSTQPSTEDTTGGPDDDYLSGGRDDDTLTGGGGNDTFTTSMGNDTIDGGDGDDTLVVFGRLSNFNIAGTASSMTLSDTTGLDGNMTATSVERVFFVTDGETYTGEELLGYNGTEGDDVINASDRDSTIHGLAGNDALNGFGGDDDIDGGDGNDVIDGGAGYDTIDGGPGDDVAKFSGSSSDYRASLAANGKLYVEDSDGFDVLRNVETLYFEGDDITFAVQDLPPSGTAGNDEIIGTFLGDVLSGFDGDDILVGGSGNDVLDGGPGADQMLGGEGNDAYVVDSVNDSVTEELDSGFDSITSSISYTLGANIEDLFLQGGDIAINGTGNELDNYMYGDDFGNNLQGLSGDDYFLGGWGDDTIDGGDGTDTAGYFNSSADYLAYREMDGSVTVIDGLDSGEGTDTLLNIEEIEFWGDNVALDVSSLPLRGTDGDDVLIGGSGNDTLYGLEGNDRLVGGTGDDTLDGGDGTDVAVFAGAQTSYTLQTAAGSVQVIDNDAASDGDDGVDTLTSIATLQFKDGSTSLAAPIVLDLDGNGVHLVDKVASGAQFDWNGDGKTDRTGWIAGGDGLLAFDRNGDSTISGANELSFVNDAAGAASDLAGLNAFDSNHDGELSGSDDNWSRFGVWSDANGDGKVDPGEFLAMTQIGITSLDLTGTPTQETHQLGENLVVNTGSFSWSDGTTGSFADAVFSYQGSTASHQKRIGGALLRELGSDGQSNRVGARGIQEAFSHAERFIQATATFGLRASGELSADNDFATNSDLHRWSFARSAATSR